MTMWVSLAQFRAMSPEQRANKNIGIDFTLDRDPQAEQRAGERDYRDERQHGWGLECS